jgi:hypothetical protein
VKGGFFLRKKPLECVLSVYTDSENAIRLASGIPETCCGREGLREESGPPANALNGVSVVEEVLSELGGALVFLMAPHTLEASSLFSWR